MRKAIWILLMFGQIKTYAQEKELKHFVYKYFLEIDNSQYYTDWIKKIDTTSQLEKDLNDTLYKKHGVTCYKIKNHILMQNNSIQAALRYILSTRYRTSTEQPSDSLFTLVLFFNYGKGKDAKQLLKKNYRLVIKEKLNYTSTSNVEGYRHTYHDKNKLYTGTSYNFNNKKIFPAPLMIARSKPNSAEHILLIYYFRHYSVKE